MRLAASTSDRRLRAVAAALIAALAGCRAPAPTLVVDMPVFDDTVRLEIRDAQPQDARAAAAELEAALRRDSADWHAWEPSALTGINTALAAGVEVQAPPAVLQLIARSMPLHEASDGLFDPAIGGLIDAWGFHTSTFPVQTAPPTARRIAAWRAQRPRLSELRISGDRVRSDNRAMQLDFGAISEGLAAERALAILRRHHIRQAMVGFGSDVIVLGDGGGNPWRVSLRDPFGGSLGEVELRDGEALFSTGNYTKFRASPTGARWAHILDPRTGYPVRGTAAAAVLDDDPLLADAGATALYVAGPAGFEATARRMGIHCALLLTEENEIMVTAALAARLHLLRDPVPLGDPIDLGSSCR